VKLKQLAAPVVALGVGVGAYTTLARGEAPATAAATATTTSVATTQAEKETVAVKRATIKCAIDLDGYFEPIDATEVRIRPKQYQGELEIVSAAAHGAAVTKGQTILQLKNDELDRQLAAAENELTGAKANAAKADADVKLGEQADALAMQMQQTEVDNAVKGVEWFDKVDGKQMLKQAELGVRNAKDNVEDQNDELDQLKKMYKSEELTNQTADIVVKRALRSLDLSKISLAMFQDRATKTTEFDHANAKQKLTYAIEQQKQAAAQLQAAQDQAKVARQTAQTTAKLTLDKAQQKYDELKGDREALTVKAPFDGVVLYGQLRQGAWQNADPNLLRVGEKVAPSAVLMTVFTPGKLKLNVDVPESKVAYVTAGTACRVVPVALPEAATAATCKQPSPSGKATDAGQAFATTIELSSVDARLLPGERASVHMDAKEAKDVLTVPLAAVSRGRVRVKGADGKDEFRDVVTGLAGDELIEIKSGLKEGDELYPKAAK
jgi:multidrug efflux pump subunit AcrA (membrane-fusion protein)